MNREQGEVRLRRWLTGVRLAFKSYMFKKRPNFCHETLLLIFQNFNRCSYSLASLLVILHHLQYFSQFYYWIFLNLPTVWTNLQWPSLGSKVDGAQQMCHVLSDHCGRWATAEQAHCCGVTSKSGFATIQASCCMQHSSNMPQRFGRTVCIPSDHV